MKNLKLYGFWEPKDQSFSSLFLDHQDRAILASVGFSPDSQDLSKDVAQFIEFRKNLEWSLPYQKLDSFQHCFNFVTKSIS